MVKETWKWEDSVSRYIKFGSYLDRREKDICIPIRKDLFLFYVRKQGSNRPGDDPNKKSVILVSEGTQGPVTWL